MSFYGFKDTLNAFTNISNFGHGINFFSLGIEYGTQTK